MSVDPSPDGAGDLYFAFGSNMSVAQMRTRCPAGRLVGVDRLSGWSFFINQRGVASVRWAEGGVVHGAVWRLTSACLANLDTYEGVVEGRYRRDRVTLVSGRTATIYVDPRGDGDWRKPGYVELIVQAAAELGLDADYVMTLARWLELPTGPYDLSPASAPAAPPGPG